MRRQEQRANGAERPHDARKRSDEIAAEGGKARDNKQRKQKDSDRQSNRLNISVDVSAADAFFIGYRGFMAHSRSFLTAPAVLPVW